MLDKETLETIKAGGSYTDKDLAALRKLHGHFRAKYPEFTDADTFLLWVGIGLEVMGEKVEATLKEVKA